MINPLKILKSLLLGGIYLYSASAAAQSVSFETFDIERLEQSELRLTGNDVTGLRYLPIDKLSLVEIGLQGSRGDYVNFHQPAQSFAVDVITESYFRYSQKTVLYGKIGYMNLQGKECGGSVFLTPDKNPFDIIEFDEADKGEKRQEKYHLVGALSFDASEKLSLGAKIDFESVNYAKFKDLRHSNKLLNLKTVAGLSYRFSPRLEMAANYLYRRNIEEVSFYIEGLAETYYSLVSHGGFWGQKEQFDKTGFLSESETRPLVDIFHGGGLRLNYTSSRIHFLNEFTYTLRDGYFGKRGSGSLYLSEHNSDILTYSGTFSYAKGKNKHFFCVSAEKEDIENYQTSYKIVLEPNGFSYYEYYDPVRIGTKFRTQASMYYVYWHNMNELIPSWALKAGFRRKNRDLTAIFYPYYREQNIKSNTVDLSGERNLAKGIHRYQITLGASYQFGDGNPMNDGSYATPSETSKKPAMLNELAQKEFEYLTGQHLNLNAGFRYSRPFPSLNVDAYAALGYACTQAFDIQYLPNNYFHEVVLRLGCSF